MLGDSGTANDDARAVRDAYLELPLLPHNDLWLMLGDNAYADGTVQEYQAAVFDMYPTVLRNSVLWPTLGNHDGHTADSASQSGPYYDIFTLPTDAQAGGVASGTEAYYSFDYGNIHFICLESYETDRSPSGAMMTWLEADLQLNDKEWLIAFWHHPPYTKGSHNSDTESELIDMRENALPLLEQYGVDLVLTGHSHSYERSFLLDGHYDVSSTFTPAMKVNFGSGKEMETGAYTKPTGVGIANAGSVYAVAGSSGKTSGFLSCFPDKCSLDHPAMFISLNELGSLFLDINGNRLEATFLDDSGIARDFFTILKGVDVTAPEIAAVGAEGDGLTVHVRFSERVDAVDATTLANYFLIDPPISILGAVIGEDGKTVTLTTAAPLIPGVTYSIVVNDIMDQQGLSIMPNSQMSLNIETVTISFQDGVAPDAGYTGTRDTFLDEGEPGENFAVDIELFVDGDAGGGDDLATLLLWDISQIPRNVQIDSVEIVIDVTNDSPGPYEIYAMKRDWLEGAATWNEYSTGNSWEAPGGQGASDRGAKVLGTLAAPSTGIRTFALNQDGVNLVQSWVDDPGTNLGIIIANTSTTNGLDFHSRKEATVEDRPRLNITYSEPPPELAADFGAGRGLWRYDETWKKLTVWDPMIIVAWRDAVAAAFGVGRGQWLYRSTGWQKISSWSPYDVVAWRDELVAVFDSGRGMWRYDGSGWSKMTSWEPEHMVAWGDKLVADFGAGRGIWIHDLSGWEKISSWDPYDLVAWNDELVAAFDSGRGMWRYDGASWSKMTSWEPEQMVAWGDKLATDFGAGRGIWTHNLSDWNKISSWDPYDMVAWGSQLAVAFDSGRGIWLQDMTSWRRITSWEPVEMDPTKDALAAAFGSGRGLHLYNGSSWEQITRWDPEATEVVDIIK